MANSKYEYVRSFEQPDSLLANTWIVVRIDGRGFTKLTAKYKFVKPNDRRALDLMNVAAQAVMKELPDVVIAYGNSDEFSFVFHKDCTLFERRASKLTSTIVSTFTSYYIFLWRDYFPDTPLTPPLPSFDGRAVCYPSDANLRDYMSWRQVDCHINNLYNTTFWALVQQGGMEHRAAEQELSGTVSSDKNEILFSRFGINYNNEPEIFKKGSVLYRDFFPTSTQSSPTPPIAGKSPPQLSHPQPRRTIPRPMSQPLERTLPFRDSPISTASTPRGPTFLSTSTTPSPPPSPPAMSIPAFGKPLQPSITFPQTFLPMSPPSNGSAKSCNNKHRLPELTPLPLPPPTLKPSTKPPSSLNPPNLTAHTNTSPMISPNTEIPSRKSSKPGSHSASASLSLSGQRSSSAKATLKHRSPSLSILDSTGYPQIPLRISSIPMNAKPRKLSLPSQKSFGLLNNKPTEEKENTYTYAYNFSNNGIGGGGAVRPPKTPPLSTMQELPSPPIDDIATRNAVMGSEPPQWTMDETPRFPVSSPKWIGDDEEHASMGHGHGQALHDRDGNSSPTHGEMEAVLTNAVIPPSPTATRRARSHSRLHSAPPSSYFPSPPSTTSTAHGTAANTMTGMPGNAWSRSEFPSPPAAATAAASTYQEATLNWDAKAAPQAPLLSNPPATSASTSALGAKLGKRGGLKGKGGAKAAATTTTMTAAVAEDGGWAAAAGNEGRPVQLSRTQREKERKKRTKARIVIEHVDVIKDEFWERRPWILSGRAG